MSVLAQIKAWQELQQMETDTWRSAHYDNGQHIGYIHYKTFPDGTAKELFRTPINHQ